MNAQHTPGRHALRLEASASVIGALNCLEMARAEQRPHVAFWLLDAAASHRRRYANARAALSKAPA
jgi:hypothetical protein